MGQARRKREQARAEVAAAIAYGKRTPWAGGCAHCAATTSAEPQRGGEGLATTEVRHAEGCDRALHHAGNCALDCVGNDPAKLAKVAPFPAEAGIDPAVFLATASARRVS
jgi:hypothetical protein